MQFRSLLSCIPWIIIMALTSFLSESSLPALPGLQSSPIHLQSFAPTRIISFPQREQAKLLWLSWLLSYMQ